MPQADDKDRRLDQLLDDLQGFWGRADGPAKHVRDELISAHPAEVAERLVDLNRDQRLALVGWLPDENAALLLREADEIYRREILDDLPAERVADLLDLLPDDVATDLVDLLPDRMEEEVLAEMEPEHAEDVRELERYEPDSAGGLMTTDYAVIPAGGSVSDALKAVKRDTEAETINTAYVVDADTCLQGVVSVRELLQAKLTTPISDVMVTDVVQAAPDDDREDVASVMARYDLSVLPVVTAGNRIVGIVTVDDVLEVVEEEASEDIYRMAGTASRHPTQETIVRRVVLRMPWLLTTLVVGVATARVLDYFIGVMGGGLGEMAGHRGLDLLRYVPVLMGLAGNVGIQSSTVLVRGFATGEVESGRLWRVFAGEVKVGMLVGLVCGAIAWFAAGHFEEREGLGMLVGTALFASVVWAAVLGASIPTLCRAVGVDEAIAAGPFLIALSDISACVIFFLLAQASSY